MLNLLIFAPCERVIVGEDKSSSMIALMEGLEVAITDTVPLNAAFPVQWHILTLWHRTEDVLQDTPRKQRIDIVRPDGEPAGGGESEFIVRNEYENYRNVLRVPAFPIGVEGTCWLKLFLQRADGDDWDKIAEFPVRVKHNRIENGKQTT